MPGGLFPSKSMLEFDTTEKNIFITDLPKEKFSILDQVKNNNGFASVTDNIGIGINPNEDFIKEFEVNEYNKNIRTKTSLEIKMYFR